VFESFSNAKLSPFGRLIFALRLIWSLDLAWAALLCSV